MYNVLSNQSEVGGFIFFVSMIMIKSDVGTPRFQRKNFVRKDGGICETIKKTGPKISVPRDGNMFCIVAGDFFDVVELDKTLKRSSPAARSMQQRQFSDLIDTESSTHMVA